MRRSWILRCPRVIIECGHGTAVSSASLAPKHTRLKAYDWCHMCPEYTEAHINLTRPTSRRYARRLTLPSRAAVHWSPAPSRPIVARARSNL